MAYIGQIKDRNGNTVYPKTVVAALADYTPLNISQPTTLGIAYLNGSYDAWANATSYRTIELPDARIVALSVHVVSTTKISASNNFHLALLSIPSNIRPLYGQMVIEGATGSNGVFAPFYLGVGKSGTVSVDLPTNVESLPNTTGFHAEFFYLAAKN